MSTKANKVVNKRRLRWPIGGPARTSKTGGFTRTLTLALSSGGFRNLLAKKHSTTDSLDEGTKERRQKPSMLKLVCGFTLVEMMVASAIFTVVSVVAIGAVITVNNANRKAQAIRAVVDNLNFTMESMSRKLRVGSQYHCGTSDGTVGHENFTGVASDCLGGVSSMSYLSSGVTVRAVGETAAVDKRPRVVTYEFIPGASGANGKIITRQAPDGPSSFASLTIAWAIGCSECAFTDAAS